MTIESVPIDRRARGTRVLRLALAIVLGVTMLATLGETAQAAPTPFVTANPNPVTIPWGETSGTYDLSWDTGSSAAAELRFSQNGGPFSAPFVQTPSGSGQLPINFGDTFVWRLSLPGSGRAIAQVTVTTRHPDKSCEGQCIKLVEITPHGTYADVHAIFTTKIKAVEINARKFNEPASSGMFGGNVQQWNSKLLSLDPGTQYFYDLTAYDEAGNKQTWSGSFTTLKRRVSVTWTKIKVIDDSDDLSQGDLTFWFYADGWGGKFGEVGVSSGESVYPNYTMVVDGAPDDLKLGLNGRDNDCDFFDGLCTEGTGPWGGGAGSTSEQDWATAWTNVWTSVSGPGENFSGLFAMSTYGNALEFMSKGTFTVTYV